MSIRVISSVIIPILLGGLVAILPVAAQPRTIYRDGFAGRSVTFQVGEANIPFAEKDHRISTEHNKSAPSSEYIKIEAKPPAGATEAQYVHYDYTPPPAPISDRLTVSFNVKAYRPGIQIKARLVLPREKDPNHPDSPLTTILTGDTYTRVRQWQQLGLGNVSETMRKHLPVLHAKLKRAVDPTDAYIDRIIVNVYGGPGVTEVWIDDLEIGPVRTDLAPPKPVVGSEVPGVPTARNQTKALPVEFSDGRILVDGKPFFMRAIRYSDTPLSILRSAELNTVWFPNEVTSNVIEESIRHGFWIVPSLPLPASKWEGENQKQPTDAELEQDADRVANYLRRFLSGDAVLMWDLGSGRAAEDVSRVARASDIVRRYDTRRPRAVNLWDGYSSYSSYVNAIGAHRWPLFSSLELNLYKDWLAQKKALMSPGKLFWTWIQTHMPDWLIVTMGCRPDTLQFPNPIGPHPEQIRTLTYISLAAGCRGIGYWSDKFLSNELHGRDRLLEIALLNSEIKMLEPVLFTAGDSAQWIPTNDYQVQAAVIRGAKELLVLPIWLGAGTQYVPALATVRSLKFVVPRVPDNTTPWLVTPAGVTELRERRQVAGGMELTLEEFDTTAAIVFTSDLGADGKIARWQDHTRFHLGEQAALWAQQQAIEQYNKTLATHGNILAAGGPEIPEANELFENAKRRIQLAKAYAENKQWDVAYREAKRAQRPLRILMQADWNKAVQPLDAPIASPYAVSFYTLPQHWRFAQEIAASQPIGNQLPHGGFEMSKPAPDAGADITSLPGWQARNLILDSAARGTVSIINTAADGVLEKPEPAQPRPSDRYAPLRVAMVPEERFQADHGKHCLSMKVNYTGQTDKDGKPLIPPESLERAVLAVDSPAVELQPGTLVRISFWLKTLGGIMATADGVVAFDSAAGEALGVRVNYQPKWKQYHLYRQVPASGKVSMTFAITGYGGVYIDDVRIEPMVRP